jgi:tetratricopeptide (TPR) repeat protein
MSKLAVASVILAMTCRAAVAGAVDECVPSSPSAVILRACTEIVESPSFGSDQKALAYKNRAIVRLSAGAVRAAIADFTESIRLNKEDALAYAGRGWARFTDKDLAGSIADYSEAIRISPNSAKLYAERGHVSIVAEKADDAIRDLNEALRLDPKNADAYNTRGFAYAKKGDFGRALEDYNAAIRFNPLNAVFYANRGYVYEAQKKKKEAIDEFKMALRFDPSLTEAMNALKRLEPAPAGATSPASDRLIRQGKEIAEKSCGSCHAVGLKDVSREKNAPEFRNLSRRHPNLTLRAPIERAIAVAHDALPPFNLSNQEVEAIIAYIGSFVQR